MVPRPEVQSLPWHLTIHGHVSCRYFEGGVSSVYLWDLDHGFAGVILIKKAGDGSKKIKGCWDSIHVVEVQVQTRPQLAASLPVQVPHGQCSSNSFPRYFCKGHARQ